MVSVRTSGQLVLDELLHFADGAAGSLAGAVRRRMDEAAQAKVLPWRNLQPSACPAKLGGGFCGIGCKLILVLGCWKSTH